MTETEKQALELTFAKYEKAVDAYAEMMQEKYVLPYLKRKGLHFMAGNGLWYIGKGDNYIDPDDLPSRVREVLWMEVPGYPANDLGSLMPDYPEDNHAAFS